MLIVLVAGLMSAAAAESYKLANGETMMGEILLSSANDQGVQVKLGEGKYERVPWANFSQEDLKKFAQNPKLEPYVEPLIEITQEDRIKKTEVEIKPVPRLELPPKQSLVGAMFSSGLGVVLLLLLYAANIYAGYEIAIFRAQSVPTVCGIAAVAPVVGPIVFLCMPTKLKEAEEAPGAAEGEAAAGEAAAAGEEVNPMHADGAVHPTGLKMHVEPEAVEEKPKVQVFQRGQFTFNRRFFETKFPNFFGMARKEEERHLVLVLKTTRGEFTGQRITRIAANDLHLQAFKGHTTEEVMIPFQDVQEIRVQPRA